jgi:hypothetical protein
MNQSFMTKFPWGTPTHFVEQLWNMISNRDMITVDQSNEWHEYGSILEPYYDYSYTFEKEKLHTIRLQSNRYKVGQMQQPFIWSGKPYKDPIFRFMPPMPLISKQEIIITPSYWIFIDGKTLKSNDVDRLALNDGFDNTEDFFKWFTKRPFFGEIRHYTDLKY